MMLAAITATFQLQTGVGTTTPQDNTSYITLLAKKPGTTVLFADEARPVTLYNIIRRIRVKMTMEFWLANRQWARDLFEGQGGCRPGYSCLSLVVASDAVSRIGGGTEKVYLDLASCFTNQDLQYFLNTMRSRGATDLDIALAWSFHANEPKFQVVVNHCLTRLIKKSNGLNQGCSSSGDFFIQSTDSVLRQMSALTPMTTPSITAFVDDTKLTANPEHSTQLKHQELQAQLDLYSNWTSESGHSIKPIKSGVITANEYFLFNPLYVTANSTRVPLPIVHEYKYLGIAENYEGADWGIHAAKLLAKGKAAMIDLKATMGRAVPPWMRILMAKTYVLSVLEYGLPAIAVWLTFPSQKHHTFTADLDALLTELVCYFFSFGAIIDTRKLKMADRSLLFSMANFPTANRLLQESEARFYFHLVSRGTTNPAVTLMQFFQKEAKIFRPHIVLAYLADPPLLAKEYTNYTAQTTKVSKPLTLNDWLALDRTSQYISKRTKKIVRKKHLDPILFFESPICFKKALTVRYGLPMFFRRHCSVCQRRFHPRTCLATCCNLMAFLPSQSKLHKGWLTYQKTIRNLPSHTGTNTGPTQTQLLSFFPGLATSTSVERGERESEEIEVGEAFVSVLDYLIGVKEETFEQAYDHVSSIIRDTKKKPTLE